MSRLAAENNAINLGQGFPDFPMNEELVGLVNQAMKAGHNQYPPMAGWLPLREAIAEKIETLYGAACNPETEITITPGGTYAIYSALTAILQPGDDVIIFEPAYDSYIPNVEINGARAVTINLMVPGFGIDWQAVRAAINERTKAIIINSPHNPTGTLLSADDMEQLQSVVKDTNIFIIADEVYEHLVFGGWQHESVLKYPELRKRSFACFSFGKVYNCTGWKLGYCVAPPELSAEFRKVHQFNCFSCFTPAQVALAEFLKNKDAYLSLAGFMQKKKDYFSEMMKETRFTMLDSFGSYFVCASYERISDEADKALAFRITGEAGVASIPVSAFYKNGKDDKLLRFCFAKKDETLEKAVERLRAV